MSGFTLTIDRSSLSLADLVIGTDPTDGFVLEPDFGPGRRTWDRKTAESPWVHGRALTGIRLLQSELSGTICVLADVEADASVLGDRIGELVDALSQFTYQVTFTHTEGATSQAWRWDCEPADVDLGDAGVFVDYELAALVQPVAVHIPRSPIPVSGPF